MNPLNWQASTHSLPSHSPKSSECAVSLLEPAGVASIFRKKRQRLKTAPGSLMRLVFRKKRKLQQDGMKSTVDIDEIDLDVPDWACVDGAEEQKLKEMKFLLRYEMQQLDEAITLHGDRSLSLRELYPDVYSDFRLLRFLRKDGNQNPRSAAQRYRSFLEWREKTNADAIRQTVHNSPFEPPSHLRIIEALIPCDFHRLEQLDPSTISMILDVGKWDSTGITKLFQEGDLSADEFLEYWAYMFDSLTLLLHNESMKRHQMIFVDQVCDLNGMNMRQFSPMFISKVLKPWLKMTQSNYPETAKRIFFLNPPPILSLVWNIVTPMASPSTVAKVQLMSDFNGSGADFLREKTS